jgi:hypothetical protein
MFYYLTEMFEVTKGVIASRKDNTMVKKKEEKKKNDVNNIQTQQHWAKDTKPKKPQHMKLNR